MANEALVNALKSIVVLAKSGKSDDAYAAYGKLFTDPTFATYSAPDQRQALKLMIHTKGIPTFPTPPIVDAHRAAVPPLKALVEAHSEPADYELLGLCQARIGDEAGARTSF